jgi:uncharacterized protein (TIGR00290 family)
MPERFEKQATILPRKIQKRLMNATPLILCWSGGKDCSFALHQLQQQGIYEVAQLLCTINSQSKRVNMHGVQVSLIEAQAEAIGIPLITMEVTDSSNAAYEAQLAIALQPLIQQGINTIAFGDIFLEDLRQYREAQMQQLGLHCVFPLWKKSTKQLLEEILHKGFRSMLCCIDTSVLPAHLLGKEIDGALIRQLPANADACGENGEYHSFCFDGPIFRHPIAVKGGSLHHPYSGSNPTEAQLFSKFAWLDLQLA